MEGLNAAAFAALLVLSVVTVKGQITTTCTASMLTSFTPCINFITGSSGNGASPTVGCCNSLKSLMSTSMDCTCLIITGGVPFSLPASTQLAISLPRACKSSLPIQCKASGVPLPAPGPVLFAPSPPPVAASPLSPRASKAVAALAPMQPPTGEITPTPATEPLAPTPTLNSEPTADSEPASTGTATSNPSELAPTTTTGIRPVLTPAASASNLSSFPSTLLLHLLVAAVVFLLY